MATKRPRDGPDGESDPPEEQRMRTVPSFANVIKEAMLARSWQNFLLKMEPMLRQVVYEEVERGLVHGARSLQRSPRMQIQALEPTTLQLTFGKKLSLPIFSGTKIEAEDKSPLQIFIADTSGGNGTLPTAAAAIPKSIRVEIVAIEGDFPGTDEGGSWTSEEFERKIVKERQGKRPLLTGDVSVTLRNGSSSIGGLMITDNSSWIKCRHFRIGARVARGSCEGLRIKEAITERFTVKDQRGEVYKKHYPPALSDDVWRLDKIGKDGSFHKKLASKGIKTVQEFLKLWAVDPEQIRKILGRGMTDKTWEVTLSHARTCVMNRKLYLHRRPTAIVVLDPICQVVGTSLDGYICSPGNLVGPQKAFVEQMRWEAYNKWNELEEVDETFGALIMIEGVNQPSCVLPTHQDAAVVTNHQNVVFNATESFPVDSVPVGHGGWSQAPPADDMTAAIFQNDVYNTASS